jgi:hypothetical protein
MVQAIADMPALTRAGLFFLVWVIAWLPLAIPLAIAFQWRPGLPITPVQKLPLVASLYLVAPPLLWAIASHEGHTLAVYGLPWQPPVLVSLTGGWLGGIGGLTLLLSLAWYAGWITWASPPSASTPGKPRRLLVVVATVAVMILIGLWIGFTEELVFRGYLLTELQNDYSPWSAAAIASLIFALLHLVWEGRENVPQLPGLWLMGMVLVLARWGNGGELGLAWGLHAGWVGAITTLDTLAPLASTKAVPAWVTGIDNKLLAGLMGIGFLLGTGLIIWGVTPGAMAPGQMG